MGIRVRLTEDVAGWRAGSTLGFADDRAAEDILGKGTFVVYDPAPAEPEPDAPAVPAATEEATAQPEAAEAPADTFGGEPAETETA